MSTCPKCHRELTLFTYEGIELLKCSTCQGLWFKNRTFRQVKQIGFAGLHAEEQSPELPSEPSSGSQDEEEILCPECAAPLSAYAYAYSSDIQLHRCIQCKGIWADYSALLAIEHLLIGYKESLDEAKAKAIPLMLKVKKQIQQEEKTRKAERKSRKQRGVLGKFFKKETSKNRKIEDILEDFHKNNNK